VFVGPDGQPVARVVVTLELSPAGDAPPVREVALGVEPLGGAAAGVDRALRVGLQNAVDEGARQIALHLRAAAKTDAALVRDLSEADPGTRDHAVRVLAERRNPAAVPGLVERLADPDPDVADRAVGALAEIGDPRAVEPLVDLAHRRGGRALEQIARIVGDLGGPKAKAWLETLAAGHPDAEIRAAAEESLEVLRRRAEPRARAAASR
jgi:HEAT repeat protein